MVKIHKKEATDQPVGTDIGMVFHYLFEEAEKSSPFRNAVINHAPVVDIFSTPDAIIVEVEMPGIREEEIDVSITKNTLTVQGLKYECFEEDKVNFVCMERSFGRLFRVIDIPCPVDASRIKAVYLNGLLTITMAKIEEKRGTPKKITVES
ncbi:MAG: hypothetical protein A2W63_01115 [Deltaproteobacteria bacterium RIFCSPLOWO2_02_44_9]|nr:MAG: hypothetical protein A2W63_01115 [Deltaproteobacteria bacterium RIFCSPLOWO2_02_44_9]